MDIYIEDQFENQFENQFKDYDEDFENDDNTEDNLYSLIDNLSETEEESMKNLVFGAINSGDLEAVINYTILDNSLVNYRREFEEHSYQEIDRLHKEFANVISDFNCDPEIAAGLLERIHNIINIISAFPKIFQK